MSVVTETHSSQPLDTMSDAEMNMSGAKRKHPSEGKQTCKRAKPAKAAPAKTATAGLVQLRNGKLALKQKAIEWSRSMSTLSAIIAFNAYLETRTEALSDIPTEHLHMIATLTQESDKSLTEVAKSIKNVVVPAADVEGVEEEGSCSGTASAAHVLTLSAITRAIERVAERVNYGIDDAAASSLTSLAEHSVPPGLQVWRWEVRDAGQLAPESREKLLARRQEREKAREEAYGLLHRLPQAETNALLAPKKRGKASDVKEAAEATPSKPQRPAPAQAEVAIVVEDDDDKGSDFEFVTPSPKKKSTPMGSGASNGTSSLGPSPTTVKSESKEAKKAATSPEQDAKQTEKEEKKRQRELKRAERAEKEALKESRRVKEAQAKAKAASFMSSFMQTPRPASPAKVERKGAGTLTDFERTFLTCSYKDLAPINRFRIGSGSSMDAAVESKQSREELLQDLRARSSRSCRPLRSRRGIHPSVSVRESMRLITEASILGDEKLEENGKQGLANLSDRKRVPMKLLHFGSDRRPAWYGTWTRTTNLVGPRRPLGQDPVALDYSYDSDAEWEDEDPNDGDDVQENDERDEDDGERSEDSEMDDWLVDDLEEDEEDDDDAQGRPDDDDVFPNDRLAGTAASPLLPLVGAPNVLQPKKRKIKPLGRRFDTKLVPFSTGPHWQHTLGETSYEGFKGYQILFLNDARPGLDPFSFQSVSMLSARELEPAVQLSSSTCKDVARPKTLATKQASIPAAGALAKAQTFPTQHLPALLQMIEGSTSIRPVLVEELKGKLSHLGKVVTKTSIEACVNVYAEKLSKKMGAKWVVKDEFRSTAGI